MGCFSDLCNLCDYLDSLNSPDYNQFLSKFRIFCDDNFCTLLSIINFINKNIDNLSLKYKKFKLNLLSNFI
jgi:hypothetical protein